MINGASLTMPYLEPFLNRTLREALGKLSDSTLHQDVEGFIRQEAQHYANHRRYNEMLKANGYAVLADIEATFAADYAALEKRSLEWRLAYSAGFETMTMGITDWLVNERSSLFYGANPAVTSLVLWHMVEETEHKAVAYDVYETLCGRYWLRIAGLVWGSLHVGFMSRRAYRAMLQQDGVWNTVKGRLGIWIMVGRFSKTPAAQCCALCDQAITRTRLQILHGLTSGASRTLLCTATSCRCSILANAIYRQGSVSVALMSDLLERNVICGDRRW